MVEFDGDIVAFWRLRLKVLVPFVCIKIAGVDGHCTQYVMFFFQGETPILTRVSTQEKWGCDQCIPSFVSMIGIKRLPSPFTRHTLPPFLWPKLHGLAEHLPKTSVALYPVRYAHSSTSCLTRQIFHCPHFGSIPYPDYKPIAYSPIVPHCIPHRIWLLVFNPSEKHACCWGSSCHVHAGKTKGKKPRTSEVQSIWADYSISI